ncbi:MAG: acyl-CoA dehydrogenase [Bacteroidota bacterium]
MAKEYINLRNLYFTLFDVHQADSLKEYDYYSEYNKESIDLMIQSAKQIADTHLFPSLVDMDRFGTKYEDGKVYVHPKIKDYIKELGAGGWIGAMYSYEDGGMQLPQMVQSVAEFIYEAANNSAAGYYLLTGGASRLIANFGSQEQKDQYVTKMTSGEWQGTMALTEPQAGSSLSDITTSATPQSDGSYKIKGQKIYISAGDHDAADNFIHLMLARIDGAPKGTKGISLFIVPKFREENEEHVFNDVTTAGLFHKMGQHGYATTHLIMGEKDDCVGFLVGEANKGLPYMFQMMNEARIGVGISGAAIASAAYYASLEYAKERPQGRPAGSRNINDPQTLIINHADVRRMLFFQKAVVEGSLSLVLECCKYADLEKVTEGDEKHNYNLILDLLTPIVKVYPTEAGIQSVNQGMQVLGGAGYCSDFPLEQLARDIRITAIYEGTTGIQSQDLLGRKVMLENGKAVELFYKEVKEEIEKGLSVDSVKPSAERLQTELDNLIKITRSLGKIAMDGRIEEYLADANLYLEMFSLITVGWQWIKMARIASEKLPSASNDEEKAFLTSKIKTMEFFFAYEIPKTKYLSERLNSEGKMTIKEEKEYLI